MSEILETLINASEKAALIAKSCCTGDSDETLLIAEKSEGEANERFEKDFKTIADVLAQESARVTLTTKFPHLADHVRGEECAEIGGVAIKLKSSVDETAELLKSLVKPNLAKRMAAAAHSNVSHPITEKLPANIPVIDVNDLGIWIDPIDATAEFIAGVNGDAKAGSGLPCVTVLIGAYKRSTGEPVIGVINQPFYNGGKGRLFWGLCCEDKRKWGGHNIKMSENSRVLLLSSAENQLLAQKYKDHKFDVNSVPGAGNKLLKVALGEATAYVLSKGTTFLWDTCGPHAILKAKGGDIKTFKSNQPIRYNVPHSSDVQQFCNAEGIIAFGDNEVFNSITSINNILKL